MTEVNDAHGRYKEGILLSSHLRGVRGLRYALVVPEDEAAVRGRAKCDVDSDVGAVTDAGGVADARSAAGCAQEKWLTAVFEDAEGRRMQWRLKRQWVEALHACFTEPIVVVRDLPLPDDVSKCFFAALVVHLGVVELRRLPPVAVS